MVLGGLAVRISGCYFTNLGKINISGVPELRRWQAKSEKATERKSVAKAESVSFGDTMTEGRTLEREK